MNQAIAHECIMRRISLLIFFICSFFLFSSVTGSSPSFASQNDTREEYVLKAIFIERFCRFIEWPAEAGVKNSASPFVVGVIGDTQFSAILAEIYAEQSIKEKRVELRHIRSEGEIEGCDLLFIAESNIAVLKTIIAHVAQFPILTVSASPGYGTYGVHINMYVEDEQIRFEINNNAFKKNGLTVSSLLLKVAKLVETVGEES